MNTHILFAYVTGTVVGFAVVVLLAAHVWLSHSYNSKERAVEKWRLKELSSLNSGLCNQVSVLKRQLQAKEVLLERLQTRLVALSKESLKDSLADRGHDTLQIGDFAATHRGWAKTELEGERDA